MTEATAPDLLTQSWLALQCRMIPQVTRGLALVKAANDDAPRCRACWPEGVDETGELAAAAERAIASREPVFSTPDPDHETDAPASTRVAMPLMFHDRLLGAVAVELPALANAQHGAVVQLLDWGATWLELLLRREAEATTNYLSSVVDVMAAGLEHERFQAAATAVATALARDFHCTRVSLGFLQRHRTRVRAVSHSVQFERKTNLLSVIEAAMDEACDRGTALVHPGPGEHTGDATDCAMPAGGTPVPGGRPSTVTSAHARLAEGEGGEAICTVPFGLDAQLFGALTFERPAESPFDSDTVERCKAVSALLGPVLEIKRRDDRWIAAKVWESALGALKRLAGPRYFGTKLLAAALLAAAVFLGIATGTHRVAATATLKGAIQRALVAPIDGYVESARSRAGARVKAGDVLATLDDRDLALERRRWASQHDEYANQYRRALAKLDRAEAKILRAQVAQAAAQLALLDEQLARTRILAPFDGVILSGDLSQSLGSPVERGQVLFELAPLEGYRVVLEVDEADMVEVDVGSRGRLALAALPDEQFALTVEDINGISEAKHGENVFRVEARLEDAPSYLRPGMSGVAKLEAGERRLAWIWTHALVDTVRLWLWRWWP